MPQRVAGKLIFLALVPLPAFVLAFVLAIHPAAWFWSPLDPVAFWMAIQLGTEVNLATAIALILATAFVSALAFLGLFVSAALIARRIGGRFGGASPTPQK